MAEQVQSGIFKRGWQAIGAIGNLQTLWSVCISSGIAAWVVKMLPAGWNQPQIWFVGGAAFFGTWATVASVAAIGKWSFVGAKRRYKPHSLIVVGGGGKWKAFVQITHVGESATWSAKRRIVKTVGDSPNPIWVDCFLLKDGKSLRQLQLHDGEMATIEIASIMSNDFSSVWFAIADADDRDGTAVSGNDAIVELEFRAKPPCKKGGIKRLFHVRRRGQYDIELAEVSCS